MNRKSILDTLKRLSTTRLIRRFGFRTVIAGISILLAQGAPFGYLLHSWVFHVQAHQNFVTHSIFTFNNYGSDLFYMWAGTMIFFSAFGWLIGYSLDQTIGKLNSLEHALSLSTDFESMRRDFMTSMTDNLRTPVSVAIEFLGSLSQGHFGDVSSDQKTMSDAALHELNHLNTVITNMLSGRRLLSQVTSGVEDLTPLVILKELRDRFTATGRQRKIQVHFHGLDEKHHLFVKKEFFCDALEHVVMEIRSLYPRATIDISYGSKDLRQRLQGAIGEIHLPDEGPMCHFSIRTRDTKMLDEAVRSVIDSIDRFDRNKEHQPIDLFVAKAVFEWHGAEIILDEHYEGGVCFHILVPYKNVYEKKEAA